LTRLVYWGLMEARTVLPTQLQPFERNRLYHYEMYVKRRTLALTKSGQVSEAEARRMAMDPDLFIMQPSPRPYLLRALSNIKNYCYLNALIQALIPLYLFQDYLSLCAETSHRAYLAGDDSVRRPQYPFHGAFASLFREFYRRHHGREPRRADRSTDEDLQSVADSVIRQRIEQEPKLARRIKNEGVTTPSNSSSSSMSFPVMYASAFFQPLLTLFEERSQQNHHHHNDHNGHDTNGRQGPSTAYGGVQSDPSELLLFLLDGLHNESRYYRSRRPSSPSGPSSSAGSPPSALEDTLQDARESPISKMFAGVLTRLVKTDSGGLDKKREPFWLLDAPIAHDDVFSIEDAISNTLGIFHASSSPQLSASALGPEHVPPTSSQRQYIDVTPPILVVSVKKTLYGQGALEKAAKQLVYTSHLNWNNSWTLPEQDAPQPSYRLVSVVVHHGEEAVEGHFSTLATRQYDGEWYSCDDRAISRRTVQEVESHQGALLFVYVDTNVRLVDITPGA